MKRSATGRRRPSVHITLGRAARLHRLVATLGQSPLGREPLLDRLEMGLRTFYRELELLKKCGIKVRLENRLYILRTSPEEAEGRLPFPDPQLSFAEMAELARGKGAAAMRLAGLLAVVVGEAETSSARPKKAARKPKPKAT